MNCHKNRNLEGGQKFHGRFFKESEPGRPRVSIITVCLNSEKHLEQTIKSVLSQTYDNIEYIIVDGGSTDGTINILKTYDYKITYWVSEGDDGIFDAMNKGIGLCHGEWIGIINSDDWYDSRAVERVVKASLANPEIHVFHGDLMLVGEEGRYERVKGSDKDPLSNFQVRHPSCFIRKDIYDEYMYDPKYSINADRDLILKLYYGRKAFCHLNAPIAYFRPTGISSKPALKAVIDRYRINQKFDRIRAKRLLTYDAISYLKEVFYSYTNQMKKKLY